jgi:hypothetical protein
MMFRRAIFNDYHRSNIFIFTKISIYSQIVIEKKESHTKLTEYFSGSNRPLKNQRKKIERIGMKKIKKNEINKTNPFVSMKS